MFKRVPSLYQSPLQWRHNERDGVSNHKPPDCLLKRLLKAQIKEASKLRVTGLCVCVCVGGGGGGGGGSMMNC